MQRSSTCQAEHDSSYPATRSDYSRLYFAATCGAKPNHDYTGADIFRYTTNNGFDGRGVLVILQVVDTPTGMPRI